MRSHVIARRAARVALITAACLVVPLAGAFVAAGCGGSDEGPELEGTSWSLVRWSESSLDPTDFTITAAFAADTVSGTSAVNSYSGPYTTGPGDQFSTGDMAGTAMAGPEAAMRAEQTYFELLGAAATYDVVGDTLTLFDEFGDEALVFAPAAD